jgi:phage shock protein A
MANDLEDSGKWRSTVDTRLGKLETRVEQEARLRAAMDEDLTRLDVGRDMLQSLHDTQSDHTRRLTRIEDKIETIEGRVGTIEERVGTIEEKLSDVRAGVHAILDLLDTHLARKPKWASLARMLRRNLPRGDVQR